MDSLYTRTTGKLPDNLFGFSRKRSATLLLLFSLDKVYNLIDNINLRNLAVPYLDFSKALNTVPHCIFLTKIRGFGIRWNILILIHSYLSNREQFAKTKNSKSTLTKITSEFPRGSIFEPLSPPHEQPPKRL